MPYRCKNIRKFATQEKLCMDIPAISLCGPVVSKLGLNTIHQRPATRLAAHLSSRTQPAVHIPTVHSLLFPQRTPRAQDQAAPSLPAGMGRSARRHARPASARGHARSSSARPPASVSPWSPQSRAIQVGTRTHLHVNCDGPLPAREHVGGGRRARVRRGAVDAYDVRTEVGEDHPSHRAWRETCELSTHRGRMSD